MKTNKHLKIPLLLLGLMIFISFGLGAASAATPSDNSTIYVSTVGNDTWDGQSTTYNSTTGSGPKATIANATSIVTAGGNVYIADGTYNESNIVIDKNMSIIGESQTGTIINGRNKGTIFKISGMNVNISNLTLTNGKGTFGGAISNNEGTLTLTNCTLTDNTAGRGGGIYNQGGILTIINSTVNNNTASQYGGAILNGNTLIIINSTFTNNTEPSSGAIYNEGILTVTNSTFTNNTATTYGGIILNDGNGNGEVNVTVTNSTFTNNTAGYGGAIASGGEFPVNVTVTNSTFTNNIATGDGGAIWN
ncbi:MAG: hypothetical protein K8E24_004360, partial [Methanobacterium paludis]|nr:hypothetical protein [Methanobacterium paludis]